MQLTTNENARLLEASAQKDPFFVVFTHYNRFYQIEYSIPANFQKLDTPQWSHIGEMARDGDSLTVIIRVFETEFFDIETAQKYPFLKVTI